jgi:hypothetical protein
MNQKTKKRIFLAISILFIAVCIGFTIDIFRKTSPPGSKKHLPESIKTK